MPKQGFRSITLNKRSVNRMESFIKNNRGKTIPHNIYSIDQLLAYYHDKVTKEKNSLIRIAKKIKVIPEQVMRYTL